MIRWPLNYSQLSWHISLSDLHCHGILYSNSPTTTIIFTVISKLFSTVMVHLVVWPPLPWNILLSFTYPPMFVHLHKFFVFQSNCHGTFSFFLTSIVMAYSTAIHLYMLLWSLRYLDCHGTWFSCFLFSLCFFHNLCTLISPHPQKLFSSNFDLSKSILLFLLTASCFLLLHLFYINKCSSKKYVVKRKTRV